METEKRDVISAADWKAKKATFLLSLPSGAEIEVKERRALGLVLAGTLPLDLVATVMKKGPDAAEDKVSENGDSKVSSLETLKKIVPMIQEVVVSPRLILSGTPAPEEMLFSDIPDEDLTVLISYLMGKEVSERLKPFRNVRPQSPN